MFVEAMQKMFLDLEIFPGFMVLILACIGFYCLRDKSVDMHCLMTWGMICLINGVLGVVLLVDHVVRPGSLPLMASSRDQLGGDPQGGLIFHNVKSAIRIASPVAMICTSVLTYKVYNEVMDSIDELAMTQQQRALERQDGEERQGLAQDFGGGRLGDGGGGAAAGTGAARSPPAGGQTFTPFGGQGNTLGAEGDAAVSD
eukprot:CAMPEP_0178985462 /NCGR_PEP_ID=MMETSP0795-20121207/2168_1 /TAXON_ID=88552 /ORGANISM="Amoebophrya sp., Strain Ameob2" /LENGTH=199 /DNA_ID=CAMNT_0020676427 /DNA_START=303 /DNA_END=902 /DNA_ORIENTATION=-